MHLKVNEWRYRGETFSPVSEKFVWALKTLGHWRRIYSRSGSRECVFWFMSFRATDSRVERMRCWSAGLDGAGGSSAAANSSEEPNAGASFLGQLEN